MKPAQELIAPTFLIIGAQKCGTSSLHYYLSLHPEVSMSRPKEVNFFIDTPTPQPFHVDEGNWSRGRDWYRQRFVRSPQTKAMGEASPAYTMPWNSGVAERVMSVTPEAKLVYLVRDPVDRMVSHYLHERAVGREQRPIDEALGDAGAPYFRVSQYWACLQPFLRIFPEERFLVLRQEELRENRRLVMRRVFRFLGIADDFWSAEYARQKNQSAAKGLRYRIAYPVWRSNMLRRLPPGVRWYLSRAAAARSNKPRPSLSPALRGALEARLSGDWLRVNDLIDRSQTARIEP